MRNDTGMRRGIVLVVDDDPSLLGLMRPLLEAQGYLVVSTTDSEVVNIARTVQPAMIFLEVQKSGIDGVTLSHRLRHDAATSHIPIVCVSADLARGIHDGMIADEWLAKPIRITQLWDVVGRWMPPPDGTLLP